LEVLPQRLANHRRSRLVILLRATGKRLTQLWLKPYRLDRGRRRADWWAPSASTKHSLNVVARLGLARKLVDRLVHNRGTACCPTVRLSRHAQPPLARRRVDLHRAIVLQNRQEPERQSLEVRTSSVNGEGGIRTRDGV